MDQKNKTTQYCFVSDQIRRRFKSVTPDISCKKFILENAKLAELLLGGHAKLKLEFLFGKYCFH